MRASNARFAAVFASALPSALALAQESERTVRPEQWPRAGAWPVAGWIVVATGGVVVLLAIAGLIRMLRRRGR